MNDLNGDSIQLHRWYWVRRKDDHSQVSMLWVDSINGNLINGNWPYETDCSSLDFLPVVPPEWPEEGE